MIERTKRHIRNVIAFCTSSEFSFLLTLEIILSVVISILVLFIFLKLGDDVFHKELISVDNSWTSYIYSLRSPQMTPIMLLFTYLGSLLTLFIGSVIFVFYLYTRSKKDSLIFSAILYSGIILNLILKDFFHRIRPTLLPLLHEDGYSFPSGHAMNSFVFYTAVAYFLLRITNNFKVSLIFSAISAVIILMVGVSRIYLGAHFPSDVIAGYCAGFFWLSCTILFEKTLIFRKLYKKSEEKHA